MHLDAEHMRTDFDPAAMSRNDFYRLLTATVVPRAHRLGVHHLGGRHAQSRTCEVLRNGVSVDGTLALVNKVGQAQGAGWPVGLLVRCRTESRPCTGVPLQPSVGKDFKLARPT
ncbi:hypothetical protein [Streptomyces inhibens]|uniref:hypothetical protein n=1 Tax=Streptomyces inhibens TaxID=2293571 RepID=UPI003CC82619